jgi:hypothetical protein
MREVKTRKPKSARTSKTSSDAIDERTDAPAPDVVAYEDSWYRSLKAMAQRRDVEPAGNEEELDDSQG